MPRTERTLYAGVRFTLQLDVEDHEKDPFTLSVYKNTMNATIEPGKILRIMPRSSGKNTLQLQAKDRCGKLSNLTLHFKVLPCSCKNGVCQQQNDILQPNATAVAPPNCTCSPGYTGKR